MNVTLLVTLLQARHKQCGSLALKTSGFNFQRTSCGTERIIKPFSVPVSVCEMEMVMGGAETNLFYNVL